MKRVAPRVRRNVPSVTIRRAPSVPIWNRRGRGHWLFIGIACVVTTMIAATRAEAEPPAPPDTAATEAHPAAADGAASAGSGEASGESSAKDHPEESGAREETASGRSQAHTEHADGEHGEHHDETDLTHANATSGLASPAEMRFDHILGSWVVFVLLLLIVGKLGWTPILNGLKAREASVAAKIEEAHRSAEAAAAKLQEYERKLAAAAEEARALIAQGQKDAERTAGRILAEAEAAAERERTRAMAEIAAARQAALDDITRRSVQLAELMASRIVRKQLSADDHQQLITEALEKLPSRN